LEIKVIPINQFIKPILFFLKHNFSMSLHMVYTHVSIGAAEHLH